MVLSMPQFLFLDELKQELSSDPTFLELRSKYLADPQTLPGFSFAEGLLLKGGKIWVSPSSRFKQLLSREFHASVGGGHAGITKTLRRLTDNFYWDNMKKDVHDFVTQCVTYQQKGREACYSRFRFLAMCGRIFQLILSPAFLHPVGAQLSS